LRDTQQPLVRPEILGLPATTTGHGPRVTSRARSQLVEALVAGDEQTCRQIVFDLYLARRRISAICDEVLSPAFEQIGVEWECGSAKVYQERRACEICVRILHELRAMQPTPRADAPLA